MTVGKGARIEREVIFRNTNVSIGDGVTIGARVTFTGIARITVHDEAIIPASSYITTTSLIDESTLEIDRAISIGGDR
ncbi:tetrahydrodipicolinate N-succinyltransferase [Microbacterium trichothecenolyticum]|uniref:hypothetical protein n=1 Tax=Microbacterium trichothecenolyticum TaxID=69370 RepID=UPI0028627611|nr:hypothetical protein [Microbacterium trichothecenolyticum]MDR7184910.1 tetrahydrodipicolinate N-succinyltransferase [Microbacterium trichothecenolyticum]